MIYKEASQKFKLPLKVLYRLSELKLINNDHLTDLDARTLLIVARIYGDPVLLRAQISKLSLASRISLITAPDLAKWERYIVNRYVNHIAEKSGGRLYVKQIADEIRRYYGVQKSSSVIKRIYSLRKRAYRVQV